jgi:membrane associated rhomboid family serine protease
MFPLRDTQTKGRFALITSLIIIANILVFWAELSSIDPDGFINQYALIPKLIDVNDTTSLSPFITSMFLHGGFIHIISNMWFLWIFGDNIERALGIMYLPFYLICGIAGSFLQYVIDPGSTIPMIGASGAIAGILGSYLVLFPHHRIKTLIIFFGFITVVDLPAVMMIFYWFFTQLFNGAASIAYSQDGGGVAWFAHIGGFAAGWLLSQFGKNSVRKNYAELE